MAEFDGSSDESPSFMGKGNCFEVKKKKLEEEKCLRTLRSHIGGS